jgi:Na+/H+ antiporter NhaD/arsenite permease-like protein
MKTISNLITRVLFAIAGSFVSLLCFAQEKSPDVKVDINTDKGNNWYAQPWVWIVGGAVFVLLLVALLRGNGRERVEG